MRLDVWAKKRRLSCTELANLVERKPSIVHRWLTGKTRPNAVGMRRLYRLSNGAVTPNDFYPLGPRRGPAAKPAKERTDDPAR